MPNCRWESVADSRALQEGFLCEHSCGVLGVESELFRVLGFEFLIRDRPEECQSGLAQFESKSARSIRASEMINQDRGFQYAGLDSGA